MLTLFSRLRWVSVIAVVFTIVGGTLMFVVGASSTVRALSAYFGGGKHEAFSDEAALEATVEMVSSLDQFLLALVLLIFAYGVYRLFIVEDVDDASVPSWFQINSVTDLKVKLLETVAILVAVLFLKSALSVGADDIIPWSALVLPFTVGIFAASIWLIRRAH